MKEKEKSCQSQNVEALRHIKAGILSDSPVIQASSSSIRLCQRSKPTMGWTVDTCSERR